MSSEALSTGPSQRGSTGHWPARLWVLLAACGAAAEPPKNQAHATGLDKDDAVFEAVVVHDLGAAQLAAGEAVCLATRGATTDGTALLAAIQAHYPTAVKDGECGGGGPAGPVVLTATGGKAVRIDIGPIEWNPDGTARIASGGAYRGGGVREVEYTVTHASAGWTVTAEKLLREM